MGAMQRKQPPPSNSGPLRRVIDEFSVKKQAALVAVEVGNCGLPSVSLDPKVQRGRRRAVQRLPELLWNDAAKELFTGLLARASGQPNRQRHAEARLSGTGRDLDLTLVLVYDDVVGDVQTQARTDTGRLRGKKGLEDARLKLGGDAGSAVGDLDYNVAVSRVGA